jgi:hypothetical protein
LPNIVVPAKIIKILSQREDGVGVDS